MFSYFGSKTTVAKFYPPPQHDTIIEPFAGTAKYALRYYDRDVILVDKYEKLVRIWKWLQQCSEKDILSLPRFFTRGQTLDELSFDCEEAKWLMGFLIHKGVESPRITVSDWIARDRPNHVNYNLTKIAQSLFKIRHWDIRHGSYEEVENITATYFVDPPYQHTGGHIYVHGNKHIDYAHLSEWCRSRQGQVIACEARGADWLPFLPIRMHKAVRSNFQFEVFWTNTATSCVTTQLDLLL